MVNGRAAQAANHKEYNPPALFSAGFPQEAPPKQKPKTLESTRDPDRTVVKPADDEVFRDEAEDEFARFFSNEQVCVCVPLLLG